MEKRRNPMAKFGSVDNVLDTSLGDFLPTTIQVGTAMKLGEQISKS
jgi:hypothetical protein